MIMCACVSMCVYVICFKEKQYNETCVENLIAKCCICVHSCMDAGVIVYMYIHTHTQCIYTYMHTLHRLKKARGTSTQGRLDSFFTKLPSPGDKRPAGKDDGNKNKKSKTDSKAKGGAGRGGKKK
jgi:hypothetical protein